MQNVYMLVAICLFGTLKAVYCQSSERAYLPATENKSIGLCNDTTQIISFEKFTHCHEITIKDIKNEDIISFDLTYTFNGDMSVHTCTGNRIPDYVIQNILASGSNRIVLENIIISRKGEADTAGFRNFYVN